ncbi:helix-turn-helix domain-containing protein [Micromonospora sp. NPDC020750]|uniref:helix-turn-helix domain-containing protein n=1 Tax=unclassified Micromonospora TaxID=2617518 RepID=UPI00378E668B
MSRRADTARSHPTRQHLGQQIRNRRNALGLTQREAAAMIGISQCSVTYIELASRDVLTSSLIDLAAVVDRHLAVAAEHHLPLLDLTEVEIESLATAASSWLQLGNDPTLRAALAKLAPAALDGDTYPADYDLAECQPGDPTAQPA